MQLQFAPTVESLSAFLQPYIPWIEQQLGTTYDNTLTLEQSSDPADAVAEDLLPGVTLHAAHDTVCWQRLLQGWKLPPDISPRIKLSRCRKRQPGKAPVNAWSVRWQECPVALSLKGLERPIIQVNVPVSFPVDRSLRLEHCTWFIVHRQDAAKLLAVLEDVTGQQGKYLHGIQACMRLPARYEWDSLVLDDSVTQLLRRDFELFFERESWFRRNRLPFRRGYLLYGPPGNGKTSVVRLMALHPLIEAHTMDFNEETNNQDLYQLFDDAQRSAPALVILEDLDRVFPRETVRHRECKASFHALLNCLDGVGTQDGIIVVATANDPTALDPALLRRPGRFDRVVAFRAPNAQLRRQFYFRLNPALGNAALDPAVAETEGFSFAQLRESYILAGQFAFDEGREITRHDLAEAVRLQRWGAKELKQASPVMPVGFRS